MQLTPTSWDITTILAVLGGILGVVNTYILVKQYLSKKKQSKKSELRIQPNFDISLLYSDKIRDKVSEQINSIADIKDVPFDTVEMELNVVGGIATNLKLDVFPIIDICFYGISDSTWPLRVSCIASNYFHLATFSVDGKENVYSKKREGNLYLVHVFSTALNAKLKELYPEELVFAIVTPHYYSCISYTDSYKQPQKYYLHNNHPISEQTYSENTKECSCYIDFSNSNIDNRQIEHIINLAFPENQ